jgi:hypothetical protein
MHGIKEASGVTAEDIAKKFKTKPAVKGSVGLQDIPTFGS